MPLFRQNLFHSNEMCADGRRLQKSGWRASLFDYFQGPKFDMFMVVAYICLITLVVCCYDAFAVDRVTISNEKYAASFLIEGIFVIAACLAADGLTNGRPLYIVPLLIFQIAMMIATIFVVSDPIQYVFEDWSNSIQSWNMYQQSIKYLCTLHAKFIIFFFFLISPLILQLAFIRITTCVILALRNASKEDVEDHLVYTLNYGAEEQRQELSDRSNYRAMFQQVKDIEVALSKKTVDKDSNVKFDIRPTFLNSGFRKPYV